MSLPKNNVLIAITLYCCIAGLASTNTTDQYANLYKSSIALFIDQQKDLLMEISQSDWKTSEEKEKLKKFVANNRLQLKRIDFWLRYLEPVVYKKINGPLPVEWETEVFEKFEKPYKRNGAGLALAEMYLDKGAPDKDSLAKLISLSIESAPVFLTDSILNVLTSHDHFYLANRLFLLNLATIYTTGFECPEKSNILPELTVMLDQVIQIYVAFNQSFPDKQINNDYLSLFENMIAFVHNQKNASRPFDHFMFIRDFVNPLFAINQSYIKKYSVKSSSYNDYSLNDDAVSIYCKNLYRGQNVKGVYNSVLDDSILTEIRNIGKLLFYDPLLSGNNKRSCASCHKPLQYFTDTLVATGLQFDSIHRLDRNTPSLINVEFNHLVMLDGKHFNLINQARNVLSNPIELNVTESNLMEKITSCKEYKNKLKKFAKLSTEEDLNLKHVISAIILFYSSFSHDTSPFDEAMNHKIKLDSESIEGFNIFMGKAQCGTCHFAPLFNGVKPPYVNSEFEVIGVPENNSYEKISSDKGRFLVNPAFQMLHAFRTGTIRNAEFTKPYMHNGIFKTLDELIEFYDSGGGVGKGIKVENQSLSSDSLKLARYEKKALLAFIKSLNENIRFENPPLYLPESSRKYLNRRVIGGEY